MTTNTPAKREETRSHESLSFDFSDWKKLPPLATADPKGQKQPSLDVGIVERAAAAIMLALVSPLMALVALIVKIDSPRAPVLYTQERVGIDRRRRGAGPSGTPVPDERRQIPGMGRTFEILKFRTMIPDAEKVSGPVWATERDPRITKVGRILRYLRLDEIPQLINVVRGEMRLIGPRPERQFFISQLASTIPEYVERLAVHPGITGLAQVEREYDASVDHVKTKVKYDLYYARNRSTLLDLKILIKTLDVVIRGKGAR